MPWCPAYLSITATIWENNIIFSLTDEETKARWGWGLLITCLELTAHKRLTESFQSPFWPFVVSGLLCSPRKARHTVGSESKKAGDERLEHSSSSWIEELCWAPSSFGTPAEMTLFMTSVRAWQHRHSFQEAFCACVFRMWCIVGPHWVFHLFSLLWTLYFCWYHFPSPWVFTRFPSSQTRELCIYRFLWSLKLDVICEQEWV